MEKERIRVKERMCSDMQGAIECDVRVNIYRAENTADKESITSNPLKKNFHG